MLKALKITNFRPIFFAFLAVMFGIFIGCLLYNNIVLLLVVLVLLVALFILGLTIKLLSSFKSIICVVSLFLAVGLMLSQFHQVIYYSETLDGEYTIIGRATEQIYDTTGGRQIILSELELETGKVLNSKLSLIIYGDLENNDEIHADEITPGDYIKFTAKITTQSVNIFKHIPKVGGIVFGGVKYYATTSADTVYVENGSANFFENIKINSKNNIFEYVKSDNIAGFIYATIFGDQSYVANEIDDNFKTVGVSHLISVSGLHVGFLAAMVLIVCKLFKLKKSAIFFITTFILLLYAFMCGFSAPIIRSAIMFEVMLLAGLIGKRNDNLNSLSLAGIIILILSPFSMFSIGFILSFSCMFSLIFLTEPIAKVLYKLFNVKKSKLLYTLASSLAVNIGLVCIQIYFFHSFTPIAIIANLILIPLFSIGFSVSIIFTLFGLVFSPLSYMLVATEVSYSVLIKMVESLSTLGIVVVNNPLWLCVFWGVIVFLISGHTFIKNKVKVTMLAVSVLVIIIVSVFYTLPQTPTENMIIKLSYGNILTSESGYACILIENFDELELNELIVEARYRRFKIDTIILAHDINAKFEYYAINHPELNFICFKGTEGELLPYHSNLKVIKPSEYLKVGGIEFRGFYVSESLAAVDIKFKNFRVIALPNLTTAKINFIYANNYLMEADGYLCYKITKTMKDIKIDSLKLYVSKESGYNTGFENCLNENREKFIIKLG